MKSAYKTKTATAAAPASPINMFFSIKSLFDRREPAIKDIGKRRAAHDPFG
jgi:hypothetical protein